MMEFCNKFFNAYLLLVDINFQFWIIFSVHYLMLNKSFRRVQVSSHLEFK